MPKIVDQAEQSIVRQPNRPADAAITLRQIGSMVLASCGARDYLRDDTNGYVKFRIGNGRRWCIVALAADDTYSIEVGRLRKFDWIIDLQEHGIYAEDLPAAVRRCADREF